MEGQDRTRRFEPAQVLVPSSMANRSGIRDVVITPEARDNAEASHCMCSKTLRK